MVVINTPSRLPTPTVHAIVPESGQALITQTVQIRNSHPTYRQEMRLPRISISRIKRLTSVGISRKISHHY
jgi:hypothetical protein